LNDLQVPSYLREPHIKTGYRPELRSYSACFGSLFSFHNQTCDIWSHGVGIITYIFLAIDCYSRERKIIDVDSEWIHASMITLYFLGVFSCFFCSCLFHTFGCHSPIAHEILLSLDQVNLSELFLTCGDWNHSSICN